MKERIEILSDYQRKVKLLQDSKSSHREVQPLTTNDILYMRAILHPTEKQASKDLSRELVKYICDMGICTTTDIYNDLGFTDKPVLKRLKLFRQFALVKRESKKYYMATPRLLELRERYLERICG